MANRIDYLFRLFVAGAEKTVESSKITYIKEKPNDDIGITISFITVPALSVYTAYTREFRADALFTYFRDLSNLTASGADIKINGGSVEFKLRPDLWLEEAITSIQAKNDSSSDRVIMIIQTYPRAISFY